MVTDGPYAETQEVLAGYTIVECASFDRATEIAARLAKSPNPGADPGDVRGRAADARGRAATWTVTPPCLSRRQVEGLLRDLAPQVLGARGTPVRALRHRRGRGPGGADRGRHAVAARRRTGQSPGLADHRRLAAADRPAAQRAGAAAAGGHRRPVGTAGGLAGAGRRPTRRREPTTRSSCCSCAATRRCRRPSQIALTLRAVGGLTTAEIARAFLVPEATMTRRISRAKQRIRDSGIPFAHAAASGARRRGSTRCCTCST